MQKMTQGSIVRHLLRYAIPLVLGNFFQLAYNAVDTIIVGKFAGEQALAAVSAANPVMTIVVLGVSGLSIGASVLMSRFYGAGDEETLRRELATTVLFGVAASAAVFVLGLVLAPQMLILMNVPTDILPMTQRYLRIIFVGFLFTFQYNILSAALRSVGNAAAPVRFLALASVLNALLDVVFVAGFGLGVTGAGVATVIAQAVSALLCVAYIARRVPMLKVPVRALRIDPALLRLTLESGCITALQQACQPIGKAMIQSVINAQGVSVIAAFNAVSRVDDFACIPEQSISSAMMTCIAQNRGAGKYDRVKETLRRGMMIEIAYGVAIGALVFLLKSPIMRLFAAQDGAKMLQMGVSYLSVMAFFYLLPGLTNGIQGYFRGLGEMKTTLLATFIQISIRTLVVYVVVPRVGITGAAYACAIGWLCMLVFTTYRYMGIQKRR